MKLDEIGYNYKTDVLAQWVVLPLHCNTPRVSLHMFLCGEFMYVISVRLGFLCPCQV